MSEFRELFDTMARPALLGIFGIPATFLPGDGKPQFEIRASAENARLEDQRSEDGKGRLVKATVGVDAAAILEGIGRGALPGDKIRFPQGAWAEFASSVEDEDIDLVVRSVAGGGGVLEVDGYVATDRTARESYRKR